MMPMPEAIPTERLSEMPPDMGEMPPMREPEPEIPTCFDPEANLGDVDATGNDEPKEERRRKVVERLVALYRDYKECPARKAAERRWNLEYKLLMRWKETTDPDEIVFGEIFRETETLVPQFRGLGDDFVYKARVPGGEKLAKASTAIVKDQWQRYGSDVENRAYKKNMVQFGNSYAVMTWSAFKRVARKVKRMYGPDLEDSWDREINEVVEEGPRMRHVQMWNVITHPKVLKCADSPAVFIVEGMSPMGMETEVRNGVIDNDAAKEAIKDMQGQFSESSLGDDTGDDFLIQHADDALHEYMTCYTADGWMFTVCDQKFLLSAVKLPGGRIPIVNSQLYPMADDHYSEGLPSKLASMQRFVNQLATYQIKQSGYAAQPILKTKIGTSTEKEWRNRILRPGQNLPVEKMEDAEWMEFPAGILPSLQNTIGFMQMTQKDMTGVNDLLSGQGPNQGTATLGVSLLKQATDRISYMVDGLVPDYRIIKQWMYNLDAYYLDKEYAVRVAGPDGEEFVQQYTPDVFEPDVDQQILLGTATGPEQVNMAIGIFKTVAGTPGINMLPVADKIFEAADWRPEDFHLGGPNQQGNALAEQTQLEVNGLMAEPKPTDDHMTHIQIHQMFMATPKFMSLHPEWQETMKKHLATHMSFLQQQQTAMGAQAQAPNPEMGGGQGPGGGETPVQEQANDRANGMFNMGDVGANQLGAA